MAITLVLVIAGVLLLIWGRHLLRAPSHLPFPLAWKKILTAHFPPYSQLAEKPRQRFEQDLQKALQKVSIQPVADLELNIKIRLLALAPWYVLTLRESKPRPLKRVLLLTSEEESGYQLALSEQEIALTWCEVTQQMRSHSSGPLEAEFEKLALADFEMKSWEDLCQKQMLSDELRRQLGWS